MPFAERPEPQFISLGVSEFNADEREMQLAELLREVYLTVNVPDKLKEKIAKALGIAND